MFCEGEKCIQLEEDRYQWWVDGWISGFEYQVIYRSIVTLNFWILTETNL
jgi:hypothetical protein